MFNILSTHETGNVKHTVTYFPDKNLQYQCLTYERISLSFCTVLYLYTYHSKAICCNEYKMIVLKQYINHFTVLPSL